METIVLWQQKWGLTYHIPWYLFLGGLAGGAMTVAGLADLVAGRRERLQGLARAGAWVAPPAIVLGGLALTFHLGKPERGFAFPLFFTNYHSWMTIGGWVIGAFAPLTLAYAAAWYFRVARPWRLALAALGVPLGILVSLYTGLLISAAWVVPGDRWYVPLWDRQYVPVLFVLSGLSTALAACGLAALLGERIRRARGSTGSARAGQGVAHLASLADVVSIVAEGTWVYLFLASLAAGTLGQRLAFQHLARGDLAPWFWWGFVAVGLVVPLMATLVQTAGERMLHARMDWLLYAKFTLVMAGGLLLRYVIVWGGDLKSPLIFPPSLWPVPGVGGPSLPGLGG
jgi:formate-dependent nitrite reductase membrane component NrfD